MPEWAEIQLMANYINQQCKGLTFDKLEKNPVNKQKLEPRVKGEFKLHAIARGKELQVHHASLDTGRTEVLTITMGMSGNFEFNTTGHPRHKWPMLIWSVKDSNHRLELTDHRRFAKWSFRDWNVSRGPDIVTQHDEFSKRIKESLVVKKLQVPICEALMNQSYFNGIGNYLLAEILGRLDVNPFQKLRDLSKTELNKLLKLCQKIPYEAFVLGGGQLKDWTNPDKKSVEDFNKWKKYYHNEKRCNSVITNTGRRFWYDKKWEKFNTYDAD